MNFGNPGLRAGLVSIAIALVFLLVYCVAQGYASDVGLMLTIIVVRAATGYMIGGVVGLLIWPVFVLKKTERPLLSALVWAAITGSLLIVLLAAYNLILD